MAKDVLSKKLCRIACLSFLYSISALFHYICASINVWLNWRMVFMADNKKEQERAELHRMIWNIANDLRGSVDGWDFKQYVLGMMFYRYISENLTNYINKV